MYLFGMYVLVNLMNQLDFGIACGVNVVVHPLVCCPKSNVTLIKARYKYEVHRLRRRQKQYQTRENGLSSFSGQIERFLERSS